MEGLGCDRHEEGVEEVDFRGTGGLRTWHGRDMGRNEVFKKPNCYILAGLCYFI